MAEVIVALDYESRAAAMELVEVLGPDAAYYKVGLELFARIGPAFVGELASLGPRVFLDLKLHDIPNTVAGSVRAAVEVGADMITIHATGGPAMIEAAVEAAEGRLTVLAVTVLTSLDAESLNRILGRTDADPVTEVVRLATMAKAAGAHGVVCSPHEASQVRRATGPEFTLVTPGIRLAGGKTHDQARVMSPGAAVAPE